MKWIFYLSMLITSTVFASEPVTLSGPVPPIASSYLSDTSTTVIYTLNNNVPQTLPVTVSGISNEINRITVANDCGGTMPAGPSTCNIGIAINPSNAQAGSSISQILQIDYQGRIPLTSPISFSVMQPFAYVTPNPNSNTILKFLLNTMDGTFSTQTAAYTTSTSQAFDLLTFATVGGVQYAYALDQNGFVYQCTINVDGTFNTCTGTPQTPPSWGPHGIDFATVNGVQYAYVTDVNAGLVYQCTLNVNGSLNGSFNICSQATSATFAAPYSITFATTAGVQYAYIADAGSGGGGAGSVYQCALNAGGFFDLCSPIPQSSVPNWIPYGVTFATVQGTQYAYVADNGNGSPTGNVYRCTLNIDGSFHICSPTPTAGAPTLNWFPDDIAFATLNGVQYAYVASYQGPSAGSMYVCTLNPNGTFNACTPTPVTPPSPWQPVGVAFKFM